MQIHNKQIKIIVHQIISTIDLEDKSSNIFSPKNKIKINWQKKQMETGATYLSINGKVF